MFSKILMIMLVLSLACAALGASSSSSSSSVPAMGGSSSTGSSSVPAMGGSSSSVPAMGGSSSSVPAMGGSSSSVPAMGGSSSSSTGSTGSSSSSSTGSSSFTDPNCLQYNGDQCTECYTSFKLVDGACTEICATAYPDCVGLDGLDNLVCLATAVADDCAFFYDDNCFEDYGGYSSYSSSSSYNYCYDSFDLGTCDIPTAGSCYADVDALLETNSLCDVPEYCSGTYATGCNAVDYFPYAVCSCQNDHYGVHCELTVGSGSTSSAAAAAPAVAGLLAVAAAMLL